MDRIVNQQKQYLQQGIRLFVNQNIVYKEKSDVSEPKQCLQ